MTEEGIMQCRKMFIHSLTRDEDEAERGQVGGRTAAIHGQRRWEFGGVVGTIWIWAPTQLGNRRVDVNMVWEHKVGMGGPGSVLKPALEGGLEVQGDTARGKRWQLERAGRALG